MTIGIAGTAAYLPERWMTAAEVGEASGIPADVIVEKFGLRGKHIAAADEHVSDMSVAAAAALLEEQGIDPGEIDCVMYYGSMVEYDNVSCGTPVALRIARDMLLAEDELRNVLVVAACRESYLLDYKNERSRFMFNFGDGAVAGLLAKGAPNALLGCHGVTDGSFSLQVKVNSGGSVDYLGAERYLDVTDPAAMKEGLDAVSLPNFVRAAEGALERSGATKADIAYLCGIHMKRSMHDALLAALGVPADRAVYLDDTGHMSGVDPLLALDRAARAGKLHDGDLVLLLAAGTGYTWAASVVRWGPQ
jgi:3-oxoacyl-[acyl-carrier-protein] synthase-3